MENQAHQTRSFQPQKERSPEKTFELNNDLEITRPSEQIYTLGQIQEIIGKASIHQELARTKKEAKNKVTSLALELKQQDTERFSEAQLERIAGSIGVSMEHVKKAAEELCPSIETYRRIYDGVHLTERVRRRIQAQQALGFTKQVTEKLANYYQEIFPEVGELITVTGKYRNFLDTSRFYPSDSEIDYFGLIKKQRRILPFFTTHDTIGRVEILNYIHLGENSYDIDVIIQSPDFARVWAEKKDQLIEGIQLISNPEPWQFKEKIGSVSAEVKFDPSKYIDRK